MSSNYPAGVTDAHPHFNEVDCICPDVYECDECSAEYTEPQTACTTIDCEGLVEEVERREDHEGAKSACPEHGWCTGCSSRWCEDCNG